MSLMQLTAVELGKKIKAGEVSVVEATEAALNAIEAKEDKVNSFVTVDREGALKQAEEVQKKDRCRRAYLSAGRCTGSDQG